jgi:hypothetical protein
MARISGKAAQEIILKQIRYRAREAQRCLLIHGALLASDYERAVRYRQWSHDSNQMVFALSMAARKMGLTDAAIRGMIDGGIDEADRDGIDAVTQAYIIEALNDDQCDARIAELRAQGWDDYKTA